jgi:hypothetical protein
MKSTSICKVLLLPALLLPMRDSLSGQVPLKSGAARVNITPPIGTIINGDFLPNYAREIHDSLYAPALAFDNGELKFVFIVVDNMTLDAGLINSPKSLIKIETGLKLIRSAPCKYCFSISLANGQYVYVPPASQFLLGGYETWLCSGSQLSIDAEAKISDALILLVTSIQ